MTAPTLIEFTHYAASLDPHLSRRLAWLLEDISDALKANNFEEARHKVTLGARSGAFTKGEALSLRSRIAKAEKAFNA